jgi:alpha-beta hydrolase superfamily lysophospholipase
MRIASASEVFMSNISGTVVANGNWRLARGSVMRAKHLEGSIHGNEHLTRRNYVGRKEESAALIGALTPESQAGLRQYSLDRIMGYGVDYADAIELRARVLQGEEWQSVAQALAQDLISAVERVESVVTDATRATLYYRISALLRIGQALVLKDSEDRRDVVRRSVDYFNLASQHGARREHVRIETDGGVMSGWLVEPKDDRALGSAIVVGGVEGWAMDFDCLGTALAARGVNALLLDVPGQGETRIIHGHYLTSRWMESVRKAIDFLERRFAEAPIGMVGNSMGGAIAIAMTNNDPRIAACVNNGGVIKPSLARQAGPTFFSKMVAFCGVADEERAVAIWDTVEPCKPGANGNYPLLVVQGGCDSLVNDDHARMFMAQTPTKNKHMEWFSDGIHCIYNHLADRDILISDWMSARLADTGAA